MKYYSTRDKSQKCFALSDAAFMGLAPDGGLFLPERIPQVDMKRVEELAAVSYADMALYLAQQIFDDVDVAALESVVRSAYDFPIEMRELGDDLHTLELFQGPTHAFKDFGARFMGRMTGVLNDGGETATIGVKLEGVQDDDFQGGAFGLIGAWKTAKGYVHNFARLDCSLTASAHYRDNTQVLATYPVGQTPFLNGGDEFPHVEPITPDEPHPWDDIYMTKLLMSGVSMLDEDAVVESTTASKSMSYSGVDVKKGYLLFESQEFQLGDSYDISSLASTSKKYLYNNSDSANLSVGGEGYYRLYYYKDGMIIGRYGRLHYTVS